MFKQSMMTLSTLAVLVAVSGVARAESETYANATSDGYRNLTCAEATQRAWFIRELERTDGDTPHDVPVPAECSREIVAAAEASEESK
jgi:H2-forming N5,N10-methylenetetrahydromethanopterin dehydrogenase-like enzyme